MANKLTKNRIEHQAKRRSDFYLPVKLDTKLIYALLHTPLHFSLSLATTAAALHDDSTTPRAL